MGKTLREEIIELLAVAIRVNREALIMLRGDTAYLWKTVTQLKNEGIVLVNKTDSWTMRLTTKGVSELAQMNSSLCDFYLQYSCGNKPGSTMAHKRAQCKAAEIVAMGKRTGVHVGVEKVHRGCEDGVKMGPGEAALYLLKELKLEKGQKVGRAQISRASGILLSDGINALVYNAQGEQLGLNGSAEKGTNYHVLALKQDVCFLQGKVMPAIRRSIVVGYDYELAVRLMHNNEEPVNTKQRKRTDVSAAIQDRTITGTDILFIPFTDVGLLQLKLLTKYTSPEVLQIFFREDEIAAGANKRDCEAKVRGLKCFELVTMNLSKLNRVLTLYSESIDEIGFVCLESQTEAVKNLVGDDRVHLRVVKDEALNRIIQ